MMNNHRMKWVVGIILMGVMILTTYLFVKPTPIETPEKNIAPVVTTPSKESTISPQISPEDNYLFQFPIRNAQERVTKKPFGIFITKENSPVQPERFFGYHTGTDFEVFPEELGMPVSIVAMCDGTLLKKTKAAGYGGVIVQSCLYDDRPITVVYGHLKLESVTAKQGSDIRQGDVLGILGDNESSETDGERKHLHLGIHFGKTINLRGYASKQSDLSDWIDPMILFSMKK